MAGILRMPEVAAGAAEAVLQDWAVEVNTRFAAGDVIATVETEKAVVDVEAETGGALLRILVPAGTAVEVGAPIAVVGEPGEDADIDLPAEPSAGRPPGQPRIFASPLARRLAKEAGIPVEHIKGTGPNGRIVRRDVEAAAGRSEETPGSRPQASYTDVPHSRMRQAIASRLTASKQTTPHFYLRGTARVDELLGLRRRLNDGGHVKISVTDLIVRAAAVAHTVVPAMNVIWLPGAVRSFTSVDVAVAVATDNGLVTPVVRAVDRSPISAVSARLKDLSERAREGGLRQEELEGGSLTVTSLGMHDVEEFAAIINPPQAAILAVGAAHEAAIADDGTLTTGKVIRVTLSVDHRPVDGVAAAQWMKTFIGLLQDPVRILI